jgi:hypothetical protein
MPLLQQRDRCPVGSPPEAPAVGIGVCPIRNSVDGGTSTADPFFIHHDGTFCMDLIRLRSTITATMPTVAPTVWVGSAIDPILYPALNPCIRPSSQGNPSKDATSSGIDFDRCVGSVDIGARVGACVPVAAGTSVGDRALHDRHLVLPSTTGTMNLLVPGHVPVGLRFHRNVVSRGSAL